MRLTLLLALIVAVSWPSHAQERLTGEWTFLVERWTVTEVSERNFTLTVVHEDSRYTWAITPHRASRLKGIMVRAAAPYGQLRSMNTEYAGWALYVRVFTTDKDSLVRVDWLRPVGDEYALQLQESSRKEWQEFQARLR